MSAEPGGVSCIPEKVPARSHRVRRSSRRAAASNCGLYEILRYALRHISLSANSLAGSPMTSSHLVGHIPAAGLHVWCVGCVWSSEC